MRQSGRTYRPPLVPRSRRVPDRRPPRQHLAERAHERLRPREAVVDRPVALELDRQAGETGLVEFALAATVVCAVAAIAAWVPTRLIARTDPAVILRVD